MIDPFECAAFGSRKHLRPIHVPLLYRPLAAAFPQPADKALLMSYQ